MAGKVHALSAFIALVAATLAAPAATAAPDCAAGGPCPVEKGYYLAHIPAGWDGKAQLPVAVFFHGYGASAEEVMGDAPLPVSE